MELSEILEAIQAGNFEALTDEQIAEGRAAIRQSLAEYQADNSTLTTEERDALITSGQAIIAEQSRRSDAAAEAQAEETNVDELVANLTDPEPEPEAKAPSVADITKRLPARPEPEPEADTEPESVLVAASGAPQSSVPDNAQPIQSMEDFGRHLHAIHNSTSTPSAGRVLHRAAHRRWDTADGTLTVGDDRDGRNFGVLLDVYHKGQAKARAAIDAGFNPAVLQAATGICGPTQPLYDPYTIGSPTAGILDLPSVNLGRGRVSVPTPLTYDDLRETSGIAFNYDSSDGDGTHGDVVKPCYTVTCGDSVTFELEAYQTCLKFSNFLGMFNPEYTAHVTTQSLMAHAHRVNQALISAITAATQTVDYGTTDHGGGALVNWSRDAIFHAMLYRDKYRLDQNQVIEQVWPYPVLGALQADGIARQDGLAVGGRIAEVISTIQRENNIRVQFIYDWAGFEAVANPGGFGNQTYNALVFPAGALAHATFQTLDLGEVRDSTYNSRNEYGTWVETFDGIVVNATEVMQITGAVACPSGEVGQTAALGCTAATGS